MKKRLEAERPEQSTWKEPTWEDVRWLADWLVRRACSFEFIARFSGDDFLGLYSRLHSTQAAREEASILSKLAEMGREFDGNTELGRFSGSPHVVKRQDYRLLILREQLTVLFHGARDAAFNDADIRYIVPRLFELNDVPVPVESLRREIEELLAHENRAGDDPALLASDLLGSLKLRVKRSLDEAASWLRRKGKIRGQDLARSSPRLLLSLTEANAGLIPSDADLVHFYVHNVLGYPLGLADEIRSMLPANANRVRDPRRTLVWFEGIRSSVRRRIIQAHDRSPNRAIDGDRPDDRRRRRKRKGRR